ncbi:probable carboxylesterase 12 [Ricinus communis]|uniref:probable carboxylesterase 12 n=1 Tax=Ricinus communis TaxID=3988 RepID=UPI00201A7C47|nr:probable carboxylesterase 12 [Ricinus communis]
MDSRKPDEEEEIVHDFPPFLRTYKSGRVERFMGTDIIPPSLDSKTNVQSQDVVYSRDLNLSSRLYLPKNINPDQKLPLLVYYHGGGFVIETPYSPNYHNFCNRLASQANIMIVSVDYRRAPEHHLPAAYDDSWTALKWAASHFNGNGPEEWLNCYADLGKVFLAGDSAGANIAHHMGMRYGEEKLFGINVIGIVLIHPYFWGKEPVGNEAKDSEVRLKINGIWYFACPTTSGCDDPLINPATDPKLATLGCNKVLIFVAEKDFLKDRGWFYYESLRKSGWGGSVEIIEAKEENHVFHLFNPENENAKIMVQNIVSFICQDKP